MPTYLVTLIDGRTLKVSHEAASVEEFMLDLEKRQFIAAKTAKSEEIGISKRSVATVEMQTEAEKARRQKAGDSAQMHHPLGRTRK